MKSEWNKREDAKSDEHEPALQRFGNASHTPTILSNRAEKSGCGGISSDSHLGMRPYQLQGSKESKEKSPAPRRTCPVGVGRVHQGFHRMPTAFAWLSTPSGASGK